MRAFAWLFVAGCSDTKVIAEMERALTASNVAIAHGLVASEILSHTHDVPDSTLRHPGETGFGCPGVIDKQGPEDNFFLTLDYALDGCVPDSALVPAAVSGHAGIQWSGTITTVSWDGLMVDLVNAVSGTLSGPVETAETATMMGPTGALVIGSSTVDLDLAVEFANDGITFDGDAVVQDDLTDPLVLEGVVLAPTDITLPCPTPSAGVARLDGDGKEVVVDFALPGDGLVTVERGGRVSESVDLCAYRSEIFTK